MDNLTLKIAFLTFLLCIRTKTESLGKESRLWGPGLRNGGPLPVRYFFVQAVDKQGRNYTTSPGVDSVEIRLHGGPSNSGRIRTWIDKLDRQDGTFIIRYRLYSTHPELHIEVKSGEQHLGSSPYKLKGPVQHENCNCWARNATKWKVEMGCRKVKPQIRESLSRFGEVDLEEVIPAIQQKFSHGSLAHYTVLKNKVYRKTYGSIVGFKQFSDAIVLSLARKVKLPDLEFVINLGDYPMEKLVKNPLPIFSWCGSVDSPDIVMPTYDITQSTLEMIGRISLDLLSVQGNTGPLWENKIAKGFWRGRDSCQERLDFVEMARKLPDMFDAALTNFFFFEHDEKKYGPKVKHISFFDFFKFKYQINIDGTVAAYRLPYLLAGDAVVFKQDSPYYEHFYNELQPWVHYIPLKRNLSDLVEKIEWARGNDEAANRIGRAGQQFVREKLMPHHIFCYLQNLFESYAHLLKTKPKVREGMELLEQPNECECNPEKSGKGKKNEL